jgi:hypothetical protein
VSAPAGFQTLGALPPLTLAAGAQEPVFVTLIISQETPAGTYSVTLEATSQSDPSVRATAQATIIVERVAGVVVRAPDAKEVDPGSEVVLSFQRHQPRQRHRRISARSFYAEGIFHQS